MATEPNNAIEVEAKHGDKMIEVKVRFWTNGMAKEEGKVVAKHAWSSGVVRLKRNDSHGLVPNAPTPFNSLLDIGAAIEEALMAHGIVLHSSRKMSKYFER